MVRDFKVERSGTETNSSRAVIVTSVARTEPSTILTLVGDGHASEVGTDTEADSELGVGESLRIGLGVAQLREIHLGLAIDLVVSAVANKCRLATPLDTNGLTL